MTKTISATKFLEQLPEILERIRTLNKGSICGGCTVEHCGCASGARTCSSFRVEHRPFLLLQRMDQLKVESHGPGDRLLFLVHALEEFETLWKIVEPRICGHCKLQAPGCEGYETCNTYASVKLIYETRNTLKRLV